MNGLKSVRLLDKQQTKVWLRYYDQLQLYFVRYIKGMLHIHNYPIFGNTAS